MKKKKVVQLFFWLFVYVRSCCLAAGQVSPPKVRITAKRRSKRKTTVRKRLWRTQQILQRGELVYRIGALKGPTAMGMAQMLDDTQYEFSIAASPDEIVPLIVQGQLDIAAVPANLSSVLYQKTNKQVSVMAVNTLGILYLVENGEAVKTAEDLKGKTIYASGKGATPEYALNYVLSANGIDPRKDVTIEYKSEHAEVVAALAADQTAVGLLPQPFVTTALMKNKGFRVALDLNDLWESSQEEGSRLVTGVIIVRNEFLQENPEKVDKIFWMPTKHLWIL